MLCGVATIMALAAAAAVGSPCGAAAAPSQKPQSFDHRAHAVPNPPVTLTTWVRRRIIGVVLDGSRSHSHYFSAGPPSVSGRIVSYRWTNADTGALLSTYEKPYLEFGLGITRIKLTVVDNTGDVASAGTSVTVRLPKKGQDQPPTITSISPTSVPASGGVITVRGTNFYNWPRVRVDGVEVMPIATPTATTLRVRAPPHRVGTAGVVVATGFGVVPWSQRLVLRYTHDEPTARFKQTWLRNKKGTGPFRTTQVVVLRIGPDGALYTGDLGGRLNRITITPDYRVTAVCSSEQLRADGLKRSVMGLAFNPRDADDAKPRMYASTAVLFAKSRYEGGKPTDWANGKVEELVSDPAILSGTCIQWVATVVSGLPVSAHDHSPSGIEFTNGGAMLIQSGSMTNAGVSKPGDGMGGVPDSPLSAAVLIAHINRRGFDGAVRYSDYVNPERSNQVSGKGVQVYASGIRNALSLIIHSSGAMYTADNSANQGYGPVSLSCNSAGAQPPDEPDRLLRIFRGGYYGTPNRNRGRFDRRQCVYRGPDDKAATGGYTPPLATFVSSTNGMAEYTAARFGNALRGDLFSSKVAFHGKGILYQTRLDKSGKRTLGDPSVFWQDSGLSLVVDAAGSMLMAKTFQQRVLVLRPQEPNPGYPLVVGVHPTRGPSRGGNVLLVVGWKVANRRPLVGGKPCTSSWLAWGSPTGEGAVYCKVPPGRGQVRVTVKGGAPDPNYNYRYV